MVEIFHVSLPKLIKNAIYSHVLKFENIQLTQTEEVTPISEAEQIFQSVSVTSGDLIKTRRPQMQLKIPKFFRINPGRPLKIFLVRQLTTTANFSSVKARKSVVAKATKRAAVIAKKTPVSAKRLTINRIFAKSGKLTTKKASRLVRTTLRNNHITGKKQIAKTSKADIGISLKAINSIVQTTKTTTLPTTKENISAPENSTLNDNNEDTEEKDQNELEESFSPSSIIGTAGIDIKTEAEFFQTQSTLITTKLTGLMELKKTEKENTTKVLDALEETGEVSTIKASSVKFFVLTANSTTNVTSTSRAMLKNNADEDTTANVNNGEIDEDQADVTDIDMDLKIETNDTETILVTNYTLPSSSVRNSTSGTFSSVSTTFTISSSYATTVAPETITRIIKSNSLATPPIFAPPLQTFAPPTFRPPVSFQPTPFPQPWRPFGPTTTRPTTVTTTKFDYVDVDSLINEANSETTAVPTDDQRNFGGIDIGNMVGGFLGGFANAITTPKDVNG
ncbi:uncharacterized protein LOC132198269 [Neocloeon triangulifer]|uniref:uncharacterized protein LOC132198269 n=1 Tax=Neocloeon triangulifer TaxID=2078957 RepID=UPI00286F44D4|nr:uncharacterized protein LOC132198269 [Neocloeon triangulifer]